MELPIIEATMLFSKTCVPGPGRCEEVLPRIWPGTTREVMAVNVSRSSSKLLCQQKEDMSKQPRAKKADSISSKIQDWEASNPEDKEMR